jgi:hypothetical protein
VVEAGGGGVVRREDLRVREKLNEGKQKQKEEERSKGRR